MTRQVIKTTKKKKDRTDEIFGEMVSGLSEAIGYAKGTANAKAFKAHIPKKVNVKAIRKALNMSQDAFAEHFGFSAARVKDWEQGRSSPDTAVRAYLRIIEEKPETVEAVLGTT